MHEGKLYNVYLSRATLKTTSLPATFLILVKGDVTLLALLCFAVTNLRAVPEIILGGGGAFFFPDHSSPEHIWSQSPPQPSGYVSALINPPTMDQICLDPPGQVTPPHPSDMLSTKHPPHTEQKSALQPPHG